MYEIICKYEFNNHTYLMLESQYLETIYYCELDADNQMTQVIAAYDESEYCFKPLDRYDIAEYIEEELEKGKEIPTYEQAFVEFERAMKNYNALMEEEDFSAYM